MVYSQVLQLLHAPGDRVWISHHGGLVDQCFLKLIRDDFGYLLGPLPVLHMVVVGIKGQQLSGCFLQVCLDGRYIVVDAQLLQPLLAARLGQGSDQPGTPGPDRLAERVADEPFHL